MLYTNFIRRTKNLLFKQTSSLFIYLRDHNKLINPSDSQLKLSYAHPKNLIPDAPKHNIINFKLDDQLEQLLERQAFEQYKNKILRGIVDEVEVKQPDPLWGQQPAPTHYFNSLSKVNLMAVSYPQRKDIQDDLNSIYHQHFTTGYSKEITKQLIQSSNVQQMVDISLKARHDNITDGIIWFSIENKLERGHKLHLFEPDQLIRLKYAFDGQTKFGTPVFHQILASLLRQDIPKLNKEQLLNLFYACRYSNPGKTNIQSDILKAFQPFYSKFTFQQKVNFLLAFSLTTKSLKYNKPVHKRRRYQFKQLANRVLFRLNFWDLELTNQSVNKIIFALAKLRLAKTKFITLPVLEYIKSNFDSYTEDKKRLLNAILYLPELESGEGIADQQLMTQLKEKAKLIWGQFNKHQQIRIVYNLWNLGLMTQDVLQLYKGIELQVDSTLLYYASQIELHTSSQRQWQIIQLMAYLQHIPLPYYIAFHRFYHYIKTTTEWNLVPIDDKLKNTQYYFDVMRLYDSMYKVKVYRGLREFQKFSQAKFATFGAPVHNLQLAHFAFPLHQISLDILTKKDYIPGTTQLKESFLNKHRSLKNLGWKHLAFDQTEMRELSLSEIIRNIQQSYVPYVQEQKAIIDYAEFQQAEKIEDIKAFKMMGNFEIKQINKLYAAQGEGLLEDDDQDEFDPITGAKKLDYMKLQGKKLKEQVSQKSKDSKKK